MDPLLHTQTSLLHDIIYINQNVILISNKKKVLVWGRWRGSLSFFYSNTYIVCGFIFHSLKIQNIFLSLNCFRENPIWYFNTLFRFVNNKFYLKIPVKLYYKDKISYQIIEAIFVTKFHYSIDLLCIEQLAIMKISR